MGSRGKIRFLVNANDIVRELVSISEGSKGDLAIVPKRALGLDFGPQSGPISEHRFSAHPSPNTSGFTITQRITFEDDTKADTYVHLQPGADGIIFPILSLILPYSSTRDYSINIRPSDSTVHLGTYDPTLSALYYQIILSSSDVAIEKAFCKTMYSTRQAKFSKFNVCILSGTFHIPSRPYGSATVFFTHSPRLSFKNLVDQKDILTMKCPNLSNIVAMTVETMNSTRDEFAKRYLAEVKTFSDYVPSWEGRVCQLLARFSRLG
jgi:hypothetical protein